MKYTASISTLLLLLTTSIAKAAVCDIQLGKEGSNRGRYAVTRDGVPFTQWTEVNDYVAALDQRDDLSKKGLCVVATPTLPCDLHSNHFILNGNRLLASFLESRALESDFNDFSRALSALNTFVSRNVCLAPDTTKNVCDIAPNMESGAIRGYVVVKNSITMTSATEFGGFCRRNGCTVSLDRALELQNLLVSAGVCAAK